MVDTLVGDRCGPRPRFITGGPSISSDHGGLSGSLTLALKFPGFRIVILRLIFFGLAQRYDVWTCASFGVNQHHDVTAELAKGDQPRHKLMVVTKYSACKAWILAVQTLNREVVHQRLSCFATAIDKATLARPLAKDC